MTPWAVRSSTRMCLRFAPLRRQSRGMCTSNRRPFSTGLLRSKAPFLAARLHRPTFTRLPAQVSAPAGTRHCCCGPSRLGGNVVSEPSWSATASRLRPMNSRIRFVCRAVIHPSLGLPVSDHVANVMGESKRLHCGLEASVRDDSPARGVLARHKASLAHHPPRASLPGASATAGAGSCTTAEQRSSATDSAGPGS